MTEDRMNLDAVSIEILQREDGSTMPAFRDLSGAEKEVLAFDRLFLSGVPDIGWSANVAFAKRVYLVSVSIDHDPLPEGVNWRSSNPRLLWTVEGELHDPVMGGGFGYLQHVREQAPEEFVPDRLLGIPSETRPDSWRAFAPHDMSKGHVAPGVHYVDGKLLPVLIVFHPASAKVEPRLSVKPFADGIPDRSLVPPTPRKDTFSWDLPDLPAGVPGRNFRLVRTWRKGRPPLIELDGNVNAGLTPKYSQRINGGAVATARDGDTDNWCVRPIRRLSSVGRTLPRISG